jgi:PEP-CTERM motif
MRILRALGFVMAIATICSTAQATFHEWKIDQAYSNASGTVQYVDFLLTNPTDDEQFLSNAQFQSTLHTMGFTNLPSPPVNGQHFLIATPGFAALAGLTPDYTFPATPFFNRAGDTLSYGPGLSVLTTPALSGGSQAFGPNGFVPARPTNFAGRVGSVPEPATGIILLLGAAGLWFFTWRSRRRVVSISGLSNVIAVIRAAPRATPA